MTEQVWIRTRKNPNGPEVYQVRWREVINAKKVLKSKTFSNHSQAIAFKRNVQIRLNVVKSSKGITDDLVKPYGNLHTLLEGFIYFIKSRSYKPDSKHSKQVHEILLRAIKLFKWKTTKDIDLDAVTKASAYFLQRPRYHFLTIQNIRRFVTWYSQDYWCDRRILSYKLRKTPEMERICWTGVQVNTIFTELLKEPKENEWAAKKMSPEWKMKIAQTILRKSCRALAPVFFLMTMWALRPKETSKLLVEDWDSQRARLTISGLVAKNSQCRTIIVDPECAAMLSALCKNKNKTEYIFLTSTGQPWNPQIMSKYFRRVLKKLGIPGTLYTARHYACTRLLKEFGARDIRDIMKISGHKTMSEFQKYTHSDDDDLKRIADSRDMTYLGTLGLKCIADIAKESSCADSGIHSDFESDSIDFPPLPGPT